MKKTTLIASLLIILLIILAPLIGNRSMQKIINKNIEALQSNGLLLAKSTSDTGYFNTKQHFEFILQNSDALANYLSSYTKTTMPPSINKVFENATIAVDIEYSNIVFSKAMTIQIYPLTLSSTLMQKMKSNNPEAYKHFIHFLESKGILYHIEYNLVSENFNGFIKDIDEHYDFKDKAKLLMQLDGARFEGEGDLLAPQRLKLRINTMKFDVQDGTNKLFIEINNLRNNTSYESFSKYTSRSKVYHMKLTLKSAQDDINIIINNLDVTSSSAEKNEKVDLGSKSFIESFIFHSRKMDFSLQTFHSDISINALDKQSLKNFSRLLAQSKTMNQAVLQQKMQRSLLALLSHGVEVKISDLSLQNIIINKIEALGGMKITGEVKENKGLADIEINMNVKLAKALYLKIIEDLPMAPAIVSYAKQDADAVYFDIHFKDARLMVNDKVIQ
jgi:hypothetical protein